MAGIIAVLLVLPSVNAGGGSNQSDTVKINWKKYDVGMAKGKSHGKKIILNFYADWCQYCKTMEAKTFKDRAVISYINQNFIPIKVNSDLEQKTASTYNVRGLPTTLFLSEKGERIGYRPGYISAQEMLLLLKYVGTGSYQSMSLEQFAKKQPSQTN